MALISQTSLSQSNISVYNEINRKIQIDDTASLQIQSNGGIRILSPTILTLQGMIITSGQVQILGN